jgi:hypothetical protein
MRGANTLRLLLSAGVQLARVRSGPLPLLLRSLQPAVLARGGPVAVA